MNLDAMRNAGMMGLLNATNKYDSGKDTLFTIYAEHRKRSTILDEMRKLDWFSRSLLDKLNRISKTIAHLECQFGRDPEQRQVANELGVSLQEYQTMLGEVSHLNCVSLNQTLDDNTESRSFLHSFIESNGSILPGNRLDTEELTETIARILAILSEKERFVTSLLYYEELTQKEIAEVFSQKAESVKFTIRH